MMIMMVIITMMNTAMTLCSDESDGDRASHTGQQAGSGGYALHGLAHPRKRDHQSPGQLVVVYRLFYSILFYSILFYSRLCPSTAGRSPPPESPKFLCLLLSLSMPLPVAPHLSNVVLVFQLILRPLSATLYF